MANLLDKLQHLKYLIILLKKLKENKARKYQINYRPRMSLMKKKQNHSRNL